MKQFQSSEERARSYLSKMPPSIQGNCGDRALYDAAFKLVKGFDLQDEAALRLLREYNLRSDPPWQERDLVAKMRSARNAPTTDGFMLNQSPCMPFSRQRREIVTSYVYRPAPTTTPCQPALSPSVENVYHEGRVHLLAAEKIQRELALFRGWNPDRGIVRTLVTDEVLSAPKFYNQRGIAFGVFEPCRDDFGLVGTRLIGFHHRHKPRATEKHFWTYHPNQKNDGTKIVALPFVLGAGFVDSAELIVVCEGEWDAITWAVAAGWLDHETAWQETCTVFGIRGVNTWKHFVDYWKPFWNPAARFVLFLDSDEAGQTWRAPGGFIETLRRLKHHVSVRYSTHAGCKDLNDHFKRAALTPADIQQIMTMGVAV